MNQKKRVLFVGEAVTLAHVARPMVLARALDPARYEVDFAWHPRFASLFPASGFAMHTIESIPNLQFEAALASGYVSAEDYDRWVIPAHMTGPRAVIPPG